MKYKWTGSSKTKHIGATWINKDKFIIYKIEFLLPSIEKP
jgi:hypothetical protein